MFFFSVVAAYLTHHRPLEFVCLFCVLLVDDTGTRRLLRAGNLSSGLACESELQKRARLSRDEI